MIFKRTGLTTCLAAAALLAGSASADSVLVNPSDFTGIRSTANGTLNATGNQAGEGFTLTWDISFDNNTNLFTYTYSFFRLPQLQPTADSNPGNYIGDPVGISHFNLETSLNFPGAGVIPHDQGQSNAGQPSDLFGLKFEDEDEEDIFFAELITDRVPVWGDVFGKKGKGGFWNAAFGTDPTEQTSDFSGWVATPDTQTTTTVIPTPAAIGGGLLLLGVMAFRRRLGG